MKERRSEWAFNLSTGLKSWLPEHGYRTSVQLAEELEIPRRTFRHMYQGTGIMTGEGRGEQKHDGRIYYARLYLWTELTEADPRHIPDRLIRIPSSDNVLTKSRSLSEDEYQQWVESPEAQGLLAKRNDRFKRETIMEQSTILQHPELSQSVGFVIGPIIDVLLDRVTSQIAQKLTDSPQIAELAKMITALRSAIDRQQLQVDQVPRSPRTPRTNDIGLLSSRLTDLLEGYKLGNRDDRDKLMQTYGSALMALDMVVHPLTRRLEEREELLRLGEEIKNG